MPSTGREVESSGPTTVSPPPFPESQSTSSRRQGVRWGGGWGCGQRGHGKSGQELPSFEWVQREGSWSISERRVALPVAPPLEPAGKTGSPQHWLACPHQDLSRSAPNDRHHRGRAATCLRECCGLRHHAQKWTYLNLGGNH